MLKKIKFNLIAIILLMCFSIVLTSCGSKTTNSKVDNIKEDPATVKIVDMAGREVTIPKNINRVYTTNPIGQMVLYTLNPDKLIGWNYKLTSIEKKYIPDKYQKLPVLGGSFGEKSTFNPEIIIKERPDIVINMSNIDEITISSAEEMQQKLNIPVVIVDGSLTNLDQAYNFLGDILGEKEKEKAKDLGVYCKNVINEVEAKVKEIPENERIKVYYAEGPKGLETDPKGSSHTEVLELAGGLNIIDIGPKSGYGRASVSLEQILSLNPELILVCPDKGNENGFYKNIFKDDKWNKIKAVKDKKVYMTPYEPFNWFDRPPSVNRIMGVKWLANILYPDTFNYDMNKEVKEFYDKFYHYDISDEEIEDLLKYSR